MKYIILITLLLSFVYGQSPRGSHNPHNRTNVRIVTPQPNYCRPNRPVYYQNNNRVNYGQCYSKNIIDVYGNVRVVYYQLITHYNYYLVNAPYTVIIYDCGRPIRVTRYGQIQKSECYTEEVPCPSF